MRNPFLSFNLHRIVGTCVHALHVTLLVTLLGVLSGCGIVERVTGEAARRAAREEAAKSQSRELQQRVMRFTDHYMELLAQRTDELAAELPQSEARLAIFDWQFTQSTAAVQIAAGPNSYANALDTVVLVSLNRRTIETIWIERYGDPARRLLNSYVSLEKEAYGLLEGIATDAQRAELNQALNTWFQENQGLQTTGFIRFADFINLGTKAERDISPGLLGIVGLDPLSGLDPATREFEQTRLLAERAVYYAQRMPILLEMQLARMAARVAETPESRRMLDAVDEATRLSRSLAGFADQAPALLSREREAAISQLTHSLLAQQQEMGPLVTRIQSALEAGTVTTRALDDLVASTEGLLTRLDSGGVASTEAAAPFDIDEYTRSMVELAATARELQSLVAAVDNLTPRLTSQITSLSLETKSLVNHIFVHLVLLVLVVLLAAISYRLLAARIVRSGGA